MILCHLFEDVAGCWRSGEGGKRGGGRLTQGERVGKRRGMNPVRRRGKQCQQFKIKEVDRISDTHFSHTS